MQIGNNVYCDTAIILDELERRFPDPAISSGPAGTAGLADVFATWVDVSVTLWLEWMDGKQPFFCGVNSPLSFK